MFTVPPNVEDPDADSRALLNISSAVMMVLSISAVGLRFLSRRLVRVPYLMDDWLILAALPFAWGCAIIDLYGPNHNNFGRHIHYSTADSLRSFYIAFFVFDLTYNFAIALAKFSILALYWRVFQISTLKGPLIVTAACTMAWLIACTLTAIFTCKPVHGFWDLDTPSTCINGFTFYISQAVFNILIDVTLLIIPFFPVVKLQISIPQKIAVYCIFLLGAFTTLSSSLRLHQLIRTTTSPFDPTFDLVGAAVWSVIETNLSILCACLPSMRPLLRILLHGSLAAARPRLPSHSTGTASTASAAQLSRGFRTARRVEGEDARADTEKGCGDARGAVWDEKSASSLGSSSGGSCPGAKASTVTTAVGGAADGRLLGVGPSPSRGFAWEHRAPPEVSPKSIVVETRWEVSRRGSFDGGGEGEKGDGGEAARRSRG